MDDEFVTMGEAARTLRVHPMTLSQRIARGQIRAFIDPHDRRRRLIRKEDLDAALCPIPVTVTRGSTKKQEVRSDVGS
jgi:excisionase family DNA binding protein